MKRQSYTWILPRTQIELGRRTALMGVLNVTPDSFSDGGLYTDTKRAVDRALQMQDEGADILDLGGESSRPGSDAVPEDEELRRIMPVLEGLTAKLRIPVSVDTYRAGVARRALEAGAQIVNDISAFRFDADMPDIVRRYGAAAVLMHSRGSRNELHLQKPMEAPVEGVIEELKASALAAESAGVAKARIVVDPGIGFGKTARESLRVLGNIRKLSQLQYPVLVGASRKSFIAKIAQDGPDARLWGTAAAVACSIFQGAHIVRIHDVRQMRILADVLDALEDEEC